MQCQLLPTSLHEVQLQDWTERSPTKSSSNTKLIQHSFTPLDVQPMPTHPKSSGGVNSDHLGKKCIMTGYTYGQQAYKLLDLEHCTIISSCHVTFDESGTISGVESAPWNTPAVEGQWEGLIPDHLHEPEDQDDDDHHSLPNAGPVGGILAPSQNIPERPTSPGIEELAERMDQLHLKEVPAPVPVPVVVFCHFLHGGVVG